jgi:ferredoxin
MLANYGYKDGSGEYFITIDSDKCDGCGACATACTYGVFEILEEDPNDPFREGPIARVTEDQMKKLRYTCAPCKPYLTSLSGVQTETSLREMKNLPCVAACEPGAITHSW